MKLLLENWRQYMTEVDLSEGQWTDVDLADLTTPELNRIWTMYTNTYLNAGLDLSVADAQGLRKYKATFLIDVDAPPDGIADAFIISVMKRRSRNFWVISSFVSWMTVITSASWLWQTL